MGNLSEYAMGKIGVSVSRADPRRVWAIVEAEEGGLFRSDDAGKSWTPINAMVSKYVGAPENSTVFT